MLFLWDRLILVLISHFDFILLIVYCYWLVDSDLYLLYQMTKCLYVAVWTISSMPTPGCVMKPNFTPKPTEVSWEGASTLPTPTQCGLTTREDCVLFCSLVWTSLWKETRNNYDQGVAYLLCNFAVAYVHMALRKIRYMRVLVHWPRNVLIPNWRRILALELDAWSQSSSWNQNLRIWWIYLIRVYRRDFSG